MLAALVLGTGCTENELEQLDPDVFVSPDTMDFGTVTLGAPSEQLLTVHNVGGGTLHVDSVEMHDGAVGFSVEDFDGGLVADEEVQLVVTFEPDELGPSEDVILVASDDPDEAVVEVPVSAVDVLDAPVPAIAWSPTTLGFGQVVSGAEVAMSVTVSSVGTADLALSSVDLDPSSSFDFHIEVDPAPVSLPPSHTTQIDVVYAPSDDGIDSGELVLQCNDPDTPEVRIALAGELLPAPDIDLIPSQLVFGTVEIGQSVTMDAEVWSVGDADLELGALIQTGSSEFELVSNPSHEVLAVGESAVLTVTYTPADMIPDGGQIEIPSNDPDEPVVTLLLDGSHEAVPDIEVTPLELDFGLVDLGLSATDAVVISNVGTGDLFVDAPALTGSLEFGLSAAQFPTAITAGASELILVSYTPADLTSDTGQIAIGSDDPDEPLVLVDLLGATSPVPDIDVVPTLLQFGMVQPGNMATLTSTVSNLGTSDLTLGTLALGGSLEFSISGDPSGAVLSPGGSTSLEVTYTPDNQGMATGIVDIPSDDPDEPVVHVLLSGSELPIPDIDVLPLLVDFGQVDLGQTGSHTVQVSNLGGADLDVTGVTLSASPEFSVAAATLPGVVAPGGQEVIYVSYTPADEIPDLGTLTFDSDDPDEPSVVVELLGESTPQPDIDVDPWTVDLGDVTLGDTAVGSADVLNVGDADLTVYGCSYTGDPQIVLVSCPTGAVIGAGGADLIELEFTPNAPQTFAGVVAIASTDPDEPVVTVDVVAMGAAPDIDLDPTQLDFGALEIGVSLALDAEIWNLGDGDLYLGSLSLVGSPDFTLEVDPSGLTLTPGDVTTVTVRYGPTDLGADTGQVLIPSNDPDEPVVTLALVGEHDPIPDIEVDPLVVSFGVVDVGNTAQDSVAVTNVGTGNLSVDLPVLSGSADFALNAGNFPVVLSPGDSRTMTVHYVPSDLVSDLGEVTVTSDDPDEPVVVVELTGSPAPEPDIHLDPVALSFGAVLQGDTAVGTATVSNLGTADLELGSLALIGGGDFTITVDPSLAVLAPGASTPVEVTYAPSNAGPDAGQVTIPSNDPDEPVVALDLDGEELPEPDIEVDPLLVDFGQVDVGQTSVQTVSVSNVGTAALDVSSLSLSGSAEFSWTSATLPGTVSPGQTRTVLVTYTPVDELTDTGTLTVASDDPDEPAVDVSLLGSASPQPDIDVDPWTLDFGDVLVDAVATELVTISNVGDADLELFNCSFGGAPVFWISSNPAGTVLGPGDSVDLELSFQPYAEAAYTGLIQIDSNDPDEPQVQVDVYGGGIAPDIDLQPTSLNFGQVGIGVTVVLDAEIWNLGSADLNLGTLVLSASAEFTLSVDPSTEVVLPGDHTVVSVSYTPVDQLADTGDVEIPSDDPDEPTVTLLVGGQHEPMPDIDVDPLLVDFGQVDVGQTSYEWVTVSNVGSGNLTVGLPVLSGSNEFSLSAGAFPTTLVPGASQTFMVVYSPLDMTADTGQVTVTSDDPDEPSVVVDLQGSPVPEPDIDVDPVALQYGQVQVGFSLALTSTISNTGNADLELGALSLVGSSDFAITVDPSNQTLAPGGSTTVEATYTPTNAGSDQAQIQIPSNDPDEPTVSVDLTGAEEPVPDIVVDPLLIDFGQVDLGMSPSDTVAVSNVGGASLTVSALTLSGSSDFSLSAPTLPGTIAPGQTKYVTVIYTPSDEIADTGTLTVVSDDPDEPSVDVSLSGESSDQPDIDVDPWTVDFGEVKVGDVDYEWVTISNVGDADLYLYSCAAVGSNNFWIATNPAGSTIAPGGSVQMEVAFAPDYGIAYSARVDITSDDPDETVVEVDLLGDGTEPAIQLVPDIFDFGGVTLECEETVDIAVQSVGTAPLVLDGYSFFSSPPVNAMTLDPGQLDDYVNNGWDLSPGSEVSVTVSFLPEDIASYTGLLTVTSDDPNDPSATALQEGDGDPGGYATDTFTQQGDNASDILWVVDNSCSMEDEQGYLGDDFSTFYSIINNAGVDYHISVVTTDDEDFQGATYKVIDDTTPNGAAQFAANCAVGTTGYMYEKGLQYGYDGLVKAEAGTYPNSNFWRDDAGLRVVYVSDEPDQSGSWSQYLSWYQGMKLNPDHVILSAICGTNGYQATSCTGPGGSADPGLGYVEVANATGGVLGTICDADWSTVLANLGWIAISLSDTFPLTYEAIPGTIDVYVNGTQLNVGWSYDAVLNSIVFLPAYVPANGDTIVVDYGYYGAC